MVHDRYVSLFADLFPSGGFQADALAIGIAVCLFGLVYWAIDLIDRI